LFIPANGDVQLQVKNFDFNMQNYFKIDEDTGYLIPIVKSVVLNMGDTYLWHDNFIARTIMEQIYVFSIVMIENATRLVGPWLFSGMFSNVMTEMLNNYEWHFRLNDPFRGQTEGSNFYVDFRNTQAPKITNNFDEMHKGLHAHHDSNKDIRHNPNDLK